MFKKINITLTEKILDDLTSTSKKLGISRSELTRHALLSELKGVRHE